MAGGKSTITSVLLLIWTLHNLPGFTLAQQTVMASNSTNDLPQAGTARYILNTSDIGIPKLRLAPLTRTLSFISTANFAHLNITGKLARVSDNPNVVTQGEIAYISCDVSAYPGQLTADETVMDVVSSANGPAAIILYSIDANHCNYSVPDVVHYDSLFTTIDPMLAFNLQTRLANTSHSISASILPDPTSMQQTSSSGNSTNGSSDSSNVLGPSPTTAVAMIILYSITGIITALFLIIIVTGAIRAHRHPERYGPRNALGRPRQSRAKGLARAMLETLPIVKFGDSEEDKPPTGGENVELGETSNEAGKASSSTDVTAAGDGQNEASTRDAAETGVIGAHSNHSQEDNALGCSICTEDFTKGQDIRVLPCNHKFHPDCVDPWLLNVSGTCPLCRVDLRPTTSHTSEVGPASPTSVDLAPPLEEITEAPANPAASGGRQRGSFFHNLRHLRDASAEERLAALRTYHSENRRSTATTVDVARERRLTSRLRDAFSIRTRREGGDNTPATEAEPGTDAQDQRRTGSIAG